MPEHSARQPQGAINFRRLLIKAAFFIVVILAGTTAGMLIASQLGLVDVFSLTSPSPENLQNASELELGGLCPQLEIVGADDDTLFLSELVSRRKTIVAFVAAGCGPCYRFIRFIGDSGLNASADMQVILLAQNPESLKEETDLPIWQVSEEALREYEIYVYPTIVGIAEDGRLTIVSSGFSGQLTEDFLRDNI